MTRIIGDLITEHIDDTKYVRLTQPIRFVSRVLYEEGLPDEFEVSAGFIMDFESVPIVKGTSKRGGTAHDYLSRSDSVPLVTKAIAAAVYLEIMAYRDGLMDGGVFRRFDRWWRRWLKYGVVRVAPGYFHRHRVMATYEEIAGIS
ncbi:MAG: hypothetical protein APR55_07055 [Methanolinea sp. SDB]|nr:MAG: hypothetical protein APR55_07055 [Methanolinea sp. SDB]